jgi:hypothetical protein
MPTKMIDGNRICVCFVISNAGFKLKSLIWNQFATFLLIETLGTLKMFERDDIIA